MKEFLIKTILVCDLLWVYSIIPPHHNFVKCPRNMMRNISLSIPFNVIALRKFLPWWRGFSGPWKLDVWYSKYWGQFPFWDWN